MTTLFPFNAQNYVLRPYQQEALDSIPESGAYVICLATGLGKSLTFSRVPRRGRMLILSHRDELVHQPAKYFDCSFGVEQASETSHGEEVISASVQTLVRRLDKFQPDDFDVLVTDECFPAGTLVDGQPIEKIEVGNYVTAYNHKLKKKELKKVLRVFKRPAPKKMLRIGDHFYCTPNHPIFEAYTGKYVHASQLRMCDKLLSLCGIVHVGLISIEKSKDVCPDGFVYNLEVEELNNYFANKILVHNCHHAAAPTYRKIYDYFKPRLHLGFTATPNRNDGVGLKEIYQDIIFDRNLKWGIKNGYLSNIQCLRVNIGYDLRRVHLRMGDFAQGELDKAVNIESANKAVAEAYKIYAKPPCLIFCASVAHAEALANLIPGAVAVKGGEDRSEILRGFSAGEIPCLTNCMVFTEGTDLPNVQSVIIARPTKNISLYQQMVGRGTRLYPGKEYMTLIDCVGVSEEANLCTAPSLIGLDTKDIPAKLLRKLQGNIFDLPEIAARVKDVPEVWINNVRNVNIWATSNRYNTHNINFFRMPDGSMIVQNIVLPPEDSLGRTMWQGKPEPTQKVFDAVYEILKKDFAENRAVWDLDIARRWGTAPASDKQKAIIHKKFPDLDVRNLSKFDASQILMRCFAPEPPTPKQIYFLQAHGIDTSKLSKQEAGKLIGEMKK